MNSVLYDYRDTVAPCVAALKLLSPRYHCVQAAVIVTCLIHLAVSNVFCLISLLKMLYYKQAKFQK